MKALVCTKPGKLTYTSVPDPVCGDNDVIIRIKACGICGTDKHIFKGEYLSPYPLIMGHEFSGIVTENGKNVTRFKPGDPVTAEPNLNCGMCHFCQIERRNHCLNWEGVGVTRNGGFAEYTVVPESAVFHTDGLSFEQAAFAEPVSCCVWGLKNTPLSQGDRVLIFGAGPIGLILLQLIHSGGAADVTVADREPSRLNLARQFGAGTVIETGPGYEKTIENAARYGFDLVVDATGVPAVVEKMIHYVKPGGVLLYFGVCPKEEDIRLNPFTVFKNDLKIIGSFASRATFDPAINLLNGGKLNTDPLITKKIALDDVQTVQQVLDDKIRGLKFQVHP